MSEGLGAGGILTSINLVVTIVAASVGIWTKAKLDQADVVLKRVEAQTQESTERRAERESLERRQMSVYEAVVRSLESDDRRRQEVAMALVTSMLSDPLRHELLLVLTKSQVQEIKQAAVRTVQQEQLFKQEQPPVVVASAPRAQPQHPAEFSRYRFDVFWCERLGAAGQAQAARIGAALRDSGVAQARVRMLPDSINAQAGYRVTGYVIRADEGEEAVAAHLREVMGGAGVGGQAIQTTRSRQGTANYMSAFVCPA
ncbi:hypothetical protein [Chitiniphilus shinanonensis]|uniref:hypothetical protein n=1 Tax=Chitiniphilus shinanonensis TaxID=553088 RepID=UPI0030605588